MRPTDQLEQRVQAELPGWESAAGVALVCAIGFILAVLILTVGHVG